MQLHGILIQKNIYHFIYLNNHMIVVFKKIPKYNKIMSEENLFIFLLSLRRAEPRHSLYFGAPQMNENQTAKKRNKVKP